MPVIDFSEVKGLEPIPAGTYRAECVKATAGISKKGNPKIDLQWKVQQGDYEGRIVFDTLTFTDNSLGVVKSKLAGMGLAGAVVDTDELDEFAEQIVGITADIAVVIRVGDGTNQETGEPYNDSNRVTKIHAVTAGLKDLL